MTITASSAYEAQYFLKLLCFFPLWVGEGKAGSCYVVQAGLEPTILLPQSLKYWDYSHAPPCRLKIPFLAWEVWVGSSVLPAWYSHAVEGLEGGLCALESDGDLLCNW